MRVYIYGIIYIYGIYIFIVVVIFCTEYIRVYLISNNNNGINYINYINMNMNNGRRLLRQLRRTPLKFRVFDDAVDVDEASAGRNR